MAVAGTERVSFFMRTFTIFLSVVGLLASLSPAGAEDCTAPCAGFDTSSEFQNDWIFAADLESLTSDVLYPTITTNFYVIPVEFLKLFTSIVTEPVIDPAPGENAFYDDIGTYVEELYAQIEMGPIALRVGKFDTIFSLASEMAPGINDTELVSNFDADERWGAEAILGFEALNINNSIAATIFTTDRTVLSESLFTNRGRAKLADGGAGNTDGFSSFSLALNGCRDAEMAECYDDGDLAYRIGFRYQKAGRASAEDIEDEIRPANELAYLAAGMKSFEFGELTLKLLGETAYLRHFDDGPDDAIVVTGSAALEQDRMQYIATYTQQVNLIPGEPDTREHLADFEAIYSSEDDTPVSGGSWELGAAYTFIRSDAHEDTHLFSVRFTFDYAGSVEFGK